MIQCITSIVIQVQTQILGSAYHTIGNAPNPISNASCDWSVCQCTQTEEYYICTDVQRVYLQQQMAQTHSLSNIPLQTMTPGNLYMDPLHGILPGNGLDRSTSTATSVVLRGITTIAISKHSTTTSRAISLSHQVSNTDSIIGIRSSVLASVYKFFSTYRVVIDLTCSF